LRYVQRSRPAAAFQLRFEKDGPDLETAITCLIYLCVGAI
jgi:hypothetical protein